ncbi:putative disease resistance RPP8-like protein 2 [Carex rostrata]
MGSGHFANELNNKAASFSDCFGFDENGDGFEDRDYYPVAKIDEPNCYSVSEWSMVQVSSRFCIGKIKCFHIYDFLRELAIQNAEEDNFLTVVLMNGTKLSSSTCARRVALHVYDDKMIEHASKNLRSMISFTHVPNFNKFGTLRVLHISTEPYEYFIGRNYLKALKYFEFDCSLYSYCHLPTGRFIKRSHLTYMNNVQTVRTWSCKIRDELPPSFWGNKQLRHINITCCFFCEAAPDGPPSVADLPSLLTLKGVRVRQDWVAKLPNIPNLRKLRIVIPEDDEGEPLINLLSTLNYLSSLHLEMSSSRRMAFPSCISAFRNHNRLNSFRLVESIWPRKEVVDYTLFPAHLVKLTLERFCFEEDPMPQLEKLANLRVLKLSGKIEAADDKQMIWSTGSFSHLQGLLLDVRNLEEWKIEVGAIPMLNQLLLTRCRKLQIVPDMQYLINLQEFTVHHCLDQFYSRLQEEDKWKIKHISSVSVFPWLSS